MRLAILIAASALLLVACAPQTGAGAGPSTSGGIEITVSHTSAGDALAGAGGMTLYTLAADTSGTSTCTGGCATTWPPLLGDGSEVTAGEGVTGDSGDQAAGDAGGQGVGGVWFIAPVGEPSASQGGSAAEKPSATPYRAPGY